MEGESALPIGTHGLQAAGPPVAPKRGLIIIGRIWLELRKRAVKGEFFFPPGTQIGVGRSKRKRRSFLP